MESWKAEGKVLIADDDFEVRLALREHLVGSGYRVEEAEDGAGAGRVLETGEVGALIVNPRIPNFELISRAGDGLKSIVGCIVTTSQAPGDLAVELMSCGKVEYIPKPFHHSAILAALERICHEKRQQAEERREIRDHYSKKGKLKVLYEDDPDPIYFFKLNGDFIDANPAGCFAVGAGREQLSKKNLREVRIKDLLKIGIRPFKRAAGGEPVNILLSYREKRRGEQIKDIQLTRIDLNGSPAVLCRIRDLSNRKKVRSG